MNGMGLGLGELLVVGVVGVIWLVAFIDCVRNEPDPTNRLIWAIVLLLLNVLAAVVYLIVRTMPRRRAVAR